LLLLLPHFIIVFFIGAPLFLSFVMSFA